MLMSMYYLAFKQMPDRVPLKQIVDINVNCFIKKKQTCLDYHPFSYLQTNHLVAMFLHQDMTLILFLIKNFQKLWR